MKNDQIQTIEAQVRGDKTVMQFILSELKPRGKFLTPFNIITIPIIIVGLVLIVIRFIYGLGSITNLSQEFPWGLWVGFDVVTGVAFAGGAYSLTFIVYVLNMKKYHSIVRATVLNGLLAYMFYAGALVLDLGRPWHIINPIIGNKFGLSSILFLVAWHFLLYMLSELIEFSPAIAEWLGMRRLQKALNAMTIGAVVFGISLSCLHQSGLGALFLMAKGKIHPLWYTEFIPLLFLVSSVFAGMSVIIIEGSITHKIFMHDNSPEAKAHESEIIIGLSKVAAGAMFVYLFMQGIQLIHGQKVHLLFTSWGGLFLTEVLGFVLVPMLLFMRGVKTKNIITLRIAAVWTIIGIALNRLDISIIAFKWYAPHHYYPSAGEVIVTLAVISAEFWAFRWVVNRMPVFHEHPDFKEEEE